MTVSYAETVRKAKAGDADAFALLVSEHSPELGRLAGWYLDGRDVDDALQDIWMSVHRKLWQLDDGDKLLPWLKTIAFRVCLDRRKARAAKARVELALPPDSWSAVHFYIADENLPLDEILETKELRRVVSNSLDSLAGDYGMLLRLRYMRDLEYKDIAEATGMIVNLVRQRLYQGSFSVRAAITLTAPSVIDISHRLSKKAFWGID